MISIEGEGSALSFIHVHESGMNAGALHICTISTSIDYPTVGHVYEPYVINIPDSLMN